MIAEITSGQDDLDYGELFQQVREAGLLERRRGYYAVKGALTLAALAAGWVGLAVLGDTWISLAVAAFLGVVFTQVVFFGHDAGHNQIFGSRRGNWLVGLVAGNTLTGLSFGWWVPKHSAHHAFPNQIDRDPDIEAGAIAFTAGATEARRGFGRVAARWQAWAFFPLLTLEAANLHVASVRRLLGRRDRSSVIEAVLLGLHVATYLTVLFWLLSPVKAVAFIAVQQGVFGLYLGCSFAPNHKGMPTIDAGVRLGFVERQVLTARNVSGGRFATFLLGGLNYQIEHHLFPRMPRPNLAKSQFLIRAFCAENQLSYREETIVGSYRLALAHLRSIGKGGQDPTLPGPPPAALDERTLQTA